MDFPHAASITNWIPLPGFIPSRLFSFSPIGYDIVVMSTLVTLLARVLEGMFVIGSIGSFAVLVLSAIDDLKTLLGREDSNHS